MAHKPETVFREKVRADLKTVYRCHPFPIQQKAIVGTPDFLVCISGIFVCLELKASEESPVLKMQTYNLAKVVECGGLAFIAWPQNWKNILQKLQKIGTTNVSNID
jgi:hypothetical protein